MGFILRLIKQGKFFAPPGIHALESYHLTLFAEKQVWTIAAAHTHQSLANQKTVFDVIRNGENAIIQFDVNIFFSIIHGLRLTY